MDLKIEKILRKVTKPGRYVGGESGEIIKDRNIDIRFCMAFPDVYEIGMSNLGLRILYGILNNLDYVWCERVFTPWTDFGELLRENGVDLYAVESKDSLKAFDFIGFNLQYELCYTNVLYMLSLADIPFLSSERNEEYPLVIAGGPCTYNPEPVADFFDLLVIGEGEEVMVELMELYRRNGSRTQFLAEAANIDGVYVPSLGNNRTVKKRIIKDLDKSYFPTNPIVPLIETVHDRIVLEVFRGCIRGCRFCQAGMTYRPVREKSAEVLNNNACEIYSAAGYDEISLSSLSISDYTGLDALINSLSEWTDGKKISISLPSVRLDSFSRELLDKTTAVRQSTLTFAPEAGSQRLRNIINKNLTEEDILNAVRIAYEAGKTSFKLYFMIGLPGETDEDIIAISNLAKNILGEYHKVQNKPKNKGVQITISAATFVPKAFTPFCFEPQNSLDEIRRKQKILKDSINSRKINLNYHNAETSKLEAVFARGDRKLSAVLIEANRLGLRFDGWDEQFDFDKWRLAFANCGIDIESYAGRKYEYEEYLPWDFIDMGVTKEFLIRENKKSKEGKVTPDCRTKCAGCGGCGYGG